jgi:hypothetical protein
MQGDRKLTLIQNYPLGENHYTIYEIARPLKVSPNLIRGMFQDEPGVLKLGTLHARGGKRPHVTLRIPESVVKRVLGERAESVFIAQTG